LKLKIKIKMIFNKLDMFKSQETLSDPLKRRDSAATSISSGNMDGFDFRISEDPSTIFGDPSASIFSLDSLLKQLEDPTSIPLSFPNPKLEKNFIENKIMLLKRLKTVLSKSLFKFTFTIWEFRILSFWSLRFWKRVIFLRWVASRSNQKINWISSWFSKWAETLKLLTSWENMMPNFTFSWLILKEMYRWALSR